MARLAWIVALAVAATACAGAARAPLGPGTTTSTAPPAPGPGPAPAGDLLGLALEPVASGLEQPVAIAALPGGGGLLVAERAGKIRLVERGVVAARPVLDLTGLVGSDTIEQGLLGIALHPGGSRLFVLFTDRSGDLELLEYDIESDAATIDRAAGRRIIELRQPHKYHPGGGMQIGPDGYLWLSFGDGGGIGDRFGNGQDPHTLHATISRIDIDAATPYAVPPDNPFADGVGGAPEVWAYGMRNPWRFHVDAESQQVVIFDVGQYAWEEINVVPLDRAGANFGWPVMEGPECFDGGTCDPGQYVDAAFALAHENLCAVVGGPVYRGAAIPELDGHVFFGDFCVGWIRSASIGSGTLGVIQDWEPDLGRVGQITTFGLDGEGEILVATMGGDVLRVIAVRGD